MSENEEFEKIVKKLKRSMKALYLCLDESIANDVNERINFVMSGYQKEIERLKKELELKSVKNLNDSKRKTIQKLEAKLKLLENTGMIGASPAQFLDKIIMRDKEIKHLKKKNNDNRRRIRDLEIIATQWMNDYQKIKDKYENYLWEEQMQIKNSMEEK